MQFGDKKAKRYTGPSMVCNFFMHNWAHIRVVLEADGLLQCPEIKHEMYAHYINGIHGTKNSHQAVYVTGPRGDTGIKLRVLYESDNIACPWTAFEVLFAKEHCFEEQNDFADTKRLRRAEKRRLGGSRKT